MTRLASHSERRRLREFVNEVQVLPTTRMRDLLNALAMTIYTGENSWYGFDRTEWKEKLIPGEG